ncbi:MAG: YfaZ family outer membrane protein, partial [Gammaproteobacteria bacterium]|nr:YfaZ family outer membrane protein [Gammaproteobacteria bacterium]
LITEHGSARTLTIETGDKNLNIIYTRPIIYDVSSPVVADTRLLYTKQNDHQDLFATAGITAYSTDDFGLGAGIKIIAADPLDYTLTAMSMGASVIYQHKRFKFESSYYYAGQSLTYADGKSVSLLIVNMDYEIMHNTFIRLGYRNIKTDLNNGISADFDRGAYLGLSWLY